MNNFDDVFKVIVQTGKEQTKKAYGPQIAEMHALQLEQLKPLFQQVWNLAEKNTVPTGYALVPVKLTEEMVLAAREHHEGESYLPHSIWESMINAGAVMANNEDYFIVRREMDHYLAEQIATEHWNDNQHSFCLHNRDMTATQIDETKYRWIRSKTFEIQNTWKVLATKFAKHLKEK